MIRAFQGIEPVIPASCYVDPSAQVIGRVRMGEDCSIWPLTVVRGDVHEISIGERTNIQDNSVLHVTQPEQDHPEGFALHVGSDVTVGHGVILHACTVGDECLIGMGSTLMDGAVLEPRVLLAAGSLVPPGKVLQGGYLWVGSPVKQVRPLSGKELAWFKRSAANYVALKDRYRG